MSDGKTPATAIALPKLKTVIGLDYDGTITRDSDMWHAVMLLMQSYGHEVHIVTMRHGVESTMGHAPMERRFLEDADGVHFTGNSETGDRDAKRPHMDAKGVEVHVWIDDNPKAVHMSAREIWGWCTNPGDPMIHSAPEADRASRAPEDAKQIGWLQRSFNYPDTWDFGKYLGTCFKVDERFWTPVYLMGSVAIAAPQATAVAVPDEVASPKVPHPTSPLWDSKGNPIHANIDALRDQQRLAALALTPSPASAGEAVSDAFPVQAMKLADALPAAVFEKLNRLTIGGCDCMTKTPELQYHGEHCPYRLASEITDLLCTIETSTCKPSLQVDLLKEFDAYDAIPWGAVAEKAMARVSLRDTLATPPQAHGTAAEAVAEAKRLFREAMHIAAHDGSMKGDTRTSRLWKRIHATAAVDAAIEQLAAPQARSSVPLSDEQLDAIYDKHYPYAVFIEGDRVGSAAIRACLRDVERAAHGIGLATKEGERGL